MPNPALVDADQELRTRDELLRRATHDLRTPLGALLTWLKLLRTAPAGGPQGDTAIEMTERAARQLCALVSAIEDAQQLMAGTLELHRASVDLVAAARSAVGEASAAASARKLALEVVVPDTGVRVDADAERLQRVLERLVAAGVALTPAKGAVRIRVDALARQGRVSLQCEGLSLSAPHREALVVGPEWPDLSGPGGQTALDFAMACRLVRLQGGELRTTSAASETEIEVCLPLSRGSAPS